MKKLALSVILIFTVCIVNAQTSYSSALAAKDAQYEEGYDQADAAYKQLKNVTVFSVANSKRLKIIKDNVKTFVDNSFTSIDLSIPSNVDKVCNFISGWKLNPSLKIEDEVAKQVISELKGLKESNPETYSSSARYKELMQLVRELLPLDEAGAEPENIQTIALKYGIIVGM